jgi:GxxExxY protein
MTENEIGELVLGCAIKVHSGLGPGILESAYESCLAHELSKTPCVVKRQVTLPLMYDSIRIDAGYRLDMLINDRVVLEIKSVERLLDIHKAQLLSYLKLAKFKLGYILNFNVPLMKRGILRLVNGI